ncbi:klhl36 [Symbiodinium sp. CCMP2592]|nr:klhl36 [Symbiodinium sp. CCMP2592]
MDMDVPYSVWVSFFIILGSIHWKASSADLADLVLATRHFWKNRNVCNPHEDRMEKALRQLRESNYFLACRFLRHGNFVSLVTAPLVHGPDQQSCALIMTSYAISYAMNTCIAKRAVVLKTSGLRIIACFYYFVMFASIWLPQSGVSERAFLLYQVMGAVCYVECAIHVPASLALVLGKFCHVFKVHGTDLNLTNFPFDHGAFAMLIIVISVVLERTLRDRVAAQFKNADAESMISGFRQMLRGVCDGEVLLDGGFRIQEGTSCLNRLLCSSECLDKTIFQDLLVQDSDELERFRKFISQPPKVDNSAAQLPAQCLRLSLQCAASQRVGVDAYHVALQHLFGCEGSYHLLAFKLDVESQVRLSKVSSLDLQVDTDSNLRV